MTAKISRVSRSASMTLSTAWRQKKLIDADTMQEGINKVPVIIYMFNIDWLKRVSISDIHQLQYLE